MTGVQTCALPIYYNSGLEDVMGIDARNSDIDYVIETCAFMTKLGETGKTDNLKALLIGKYHLSMDEINRRIDKQINQMGDAIH